MNYELFENIFKYNNSNFKAFNFISIYSFIITEEKKLILFDFAVHKLILSFKHSDELRSYYLTNNTEIGDSLYPMKTNIMNYGITLLKLYFGNNLFMKMNGSLLYLHNNKEMSYDFRNFL